MSVGSMQTNIFEPRRERMMRHPHSNSPRKTWGSGASGSLIIAPQPCSNSKAYGPIIALGSSVRTAVL